MKIKSIKFYPLKTGIVILVIKTYDDIEGIGQFIGNSFKSQKYYFEERLKHKLINKKIDIKKIWDDLYWNSLGKNGWIQVLSAIDIALYDIVSKYQKKPLYKFLKLNYPRKKQMYWSIGHGFKKTIKEMQDKIEQGLKYGFEAFKIRMDWHELRQDANLEKDFKMLQAVRNMIPKKYYLGFDANGGYSESKAIYQGKRFEDLGGISHFEEPVATNNLFALKNVVKSLKIPVSFGEYEKTAVRFREIIQIANPKIIQPDLSNLGGVTQYLDLFKIVNEKKNKIMPHSPDIGILSFTSLHMSSKYSNLPHEFSPELYNYKMKDHAKIFNENILPVNGTITLDKYKHGIGLILNKKELIKRIK